MRQGGFPRPAAFFIRKSTYVILSESEIPHIPYVILSVSEISHDQSEKYMPYGNPPSDIKSPF